MTTPNEFVLRSLADQLPNRIRAARSNGLDCVRLTLAEAQAIRGALPGQLNALDARIVGARRGGGR